MIRGAVKDKVKVKVTDVSRFFFRSNECKPPVMLQIGVSLYDACNMISQQLTNYELPQSPTLLAVYMTL